MVSFTLSLSLIFLTKIVISSAATFEVTNVTLNSSESSIVETSNDTVLLLNTNLLNGQNADSTIGTNGSQPQPNPNPNPNAEQTMDRVNGNLTLPENDSFAVELSNSSLVSQINDSSSLNDSHQLPQRKISALDNFPTDFIPEYIRNSGGVIVHIFVLSYCCLALGVVCDIYFLPALEFISDSMKLPSDIAGATFMAIGTSAPELFTSIIGVFISEDDIGTGTILGTAVFNLIVIPAACGFTVIAFRPKSPDISAFPILRDSIFYILTIITLILCIKDNEVDWAESLVLIALFGVYLALMYFNAQYAHLITNEIDEEKAPLLNGNSKKVIPTSEEEWNSIESDYIKRLRSGSNRKLSFRDVLPEDEKDWIEGNCFFKYLLFPLTILFKLTLPKPNKFCFVITFTMSVVWIGSLTYVCVWMVTIISFTFGIPETVAGLTFLAAGTSVPELISSVIVVKKAGLANMAICNSIGSNIFDILFCLGVPWLLKSIIIMIKSGSIDLAVSAIPIHSLALPLTSLTLLITIFALIATFQLTNWKLGLTVGITCSLIYVAFIVIASVLEFKFA